MPRDGLLPLQPPTRSSRRCRVKFDRTAAGHDRADILTPDEAERSMVEVIAAEIIDHRSVRTRCHERVDVDALVHEDGGPARRLITIIAPDDSLAGPGIVRFADPREQQHAHVVEREGGAQHQIGGLLELPARGVRVSDAGRLLACTVQIDPQYLAIRAQLIVWILEQRGQNDRLRTRLCEVFAGVAFAESTKDALLKRETFRIGVRLAEIGGWLRVRMISQASGALAE